MTGQIEAITAQGRHPLHRRLRPGLPLHHERRHQERRRHGAGLPRGRAAEGHGVRPVPPDRPAVHRHPDHRGRARRGRLPGQQGRLPLPAGLRPGQARAEAGASAAWSWGRAIGCRRRSSRSWRRAAPSRRRTAPVVHLDLRHLGEKIIDTKIPFVRELCLKYQNIDPVNELIPVRPVVHYMMGGVHTDINGATPLPGLYAAGEVACVSINGANRLGLELAARAARLRRARRPRRRRVRLARSNGLSAGARSRRRGTSSGGCKSEFLRKTGGRERIADDPRRDAEDDGGRRGHLPDGRLAGAGGRRRCARCRSAFADVAIDDQQPHVQHRADRGARAGVHARRRRGHRQRRARSARSRAARTSAPTSRRATTSGSSRTRWSTATPTARAAVEYLPVTITRWPPAERVYGR